MNKSKSIAIAIATGLAALCSSVQAEDVLSSGFMTDYTQLRKVTDGSADYRYMAPGVENKLAKYNAVMVDEPEIFLAPDSPYRGVKAKQIDALADALRKSIAAAVSKDFFIVDAPGEGVLYLSVAASNVKLNKKKKSILGYTPIGLISGAVVGAATSKIAKKADLQSVVMELEVFDSVTEERLAAIIDSRGGDEKKEASSWEELDELMALYGARAHCRLRNARVPEEQRVNCLK